MYMNKKKLLRIVTAGTLLLLMFCAVIYIQEDRTGPLIQFADEQIVYQTGSPEETLLEGVTATDAKDGDVSETLRIDHVIEDESNQQMIVIYVAKDHSNNITKRRRWIYLETGIH